MSRALIIVGHGSHLNGDSSSPVYAHAAAIRETGAFDEVFEAFWKEEPSLPDALLLPSSAEIFIVPLFLAEGYFTREVLPREIGLAGPVTRREGRTIHYLPPVGSHPSMSELILRRAGGVAGLTPERRRSAALVIIGHGTERSATSGDTLHALIERLRVQGDFRDVTCGFLDEAPRISDVLAGVDADDVVLVPFFVAEGWHTRETIPADLGLDGEITRIGERTIWYTPPVGTLPEIADVILEMTAALAGGSAEEASSTTPGEISSGSAEPRAAARTAFFGWLGKANGHPRAFLQLLLEPGMDGRYDVRHIEDVPVPANELEALLPNQARGLARTGSGGAYRPLGTLSDLARGWVFSDLDADGLWDVIRAIYPSAVAHWHRALTNPAAAGSFEVWAARQTAMYAKVRDIDPRQLEDVVSTLCANCLRTREWRSSLESADRVTAMPDPEMAIVPCLEPCTLFATLARERMGKGR